MSDDLRFDQLLTEDAAALPPVAVNPWQEAMRRVLWGIGLTTITLNFLCLDMLLPTVGGILMVLGFRTLRQENAPLRWCWRLSIVIAALRSLSFVLDALPIVTRDLPAYGIVLLTLALYVCLWRGMVGVSRAAGMEKPAAPAAGVLAIFYGVLSVLAYIGLEGWLSVLALLGVYLVILRNLVRLSRSLADTGYAIHAAPVRSSAAVRLWSYLGLTLAAVVLALLLGQRCPMNWQAREDAPQDETIRAELLALGFPQTVLDDLTADEVAAMAGAVKVHTGVTPLYGGNEYRLAVTDHPVEEDSKPRWVYQTAEKQEDGTCQYIYRVYDIYQTTVTNVVVELPGEQGERRYVVVHHMTYTQPPERRYSEALDIWPAWQWSAENWRAGGRISGRLLREQHGQEQTADFFALSSTTGEVTGFFGAYTQSSVTARWTYPADGENVRLYVLYDTIQQQSGDSLWAVIHYLRQDLPLYPASPEADALWQQRNSDAVTWYQHDFRLSCQELGESAE